MSKQHTSPKIENAYSKSSLETNGVRFLTLIAAAIGANRIFNIRPLRI